MAQVGSRSPKNYHRDDSYGEANTRTSSTAARGLRPRSSVVGLTRGSVDFLRPVSASSLVQKRAEKARLLNYWTSGLWCRG